MKYKWNMLLLAAAMMCFLTACGGNRSDPAEPHASAPVADQPETPALKLTLEGDEGTREITAVLMDTPAAAEFAQRMPFTVEMHDHLDRQKEVYLDFSLSAESRTSTVREYETGDIVYWHPGPTIGIFYDHDGRSINAGIEVLAKLDEGGVEAIHSYADLVRVTFELYEGEASVEASEDADQDGSVSLSP